MHAETICEIEPPAYFDWGPSGVEKGPYTGQATPKVTPACHTRYVVRCWQTLGHVFDTSTALSNCIKWRMGMRHGCTPDMELVASRDAPTWAALGRAPQWQMQKLHARGNAYRKHAYWGHSHVTWPAGVARSGDSTLTMLARGQVRHHPHAKYETYNPHIPHTAACPDHTRCMHG